jgi:cytidyltransferase-like protein
MSSLVKAQICFTIGCFDHFHYGHIRLLERMRAAAHLVVVGIHDDASLCSLKSLKSEQIVPIEQRVAAVAQYADHVFVVNSTDPTPALHDAIVKHAGDVDLPLFDNCIYMRGRDMPAFPGRGLVEPIMRIELVDYTEGISSTMIRNMAHVVDTGDAD